MKPIVKRVIATLVAIVVFMIGSSLSLLVKLGIYKDGSLSPLVASLVVTTCYVLSIWLAIKAWRIIANLGDK